MLGLLRSPIAKRVKMGKEATLRMCMRTQGSANLKLNVKASVAARKLLEY